MMTKAQIAAQRTYSILMEILSQSLQTMKVHVGINGPEEVRDDQPSKDD